MRTAAAGMIGLALVVGACGSRSTGTSALSGKKPAVIHMAATSSAAGASATSRAAGKIAAEAAPSPSGAMADAAMMPVRKVVYVAAPGLAVLDGSAAAWRYPADRRASADQVAALAKALGLTGKPLAVSADEGGGWRVGPNDGTGPMLQVSDDAMGSWSYSSGLGGYAVASCATVGGAVTPIDSKGVAGGGSAPDAATTAVAVDAPPPAQTPPTAQTAPPADAPPPAQMLPAPSCEPPAPPTGVPDQAAAKAAGLAFAAKLGVATKDAVVEVSGGEYGRLVTISPVLGGVASPFGTSISYGGEAAVQFVSGTLLSPEPAAPYDRIGTAAALVALNASSGFGREYMGGGGVGVAVGSGVASSGVAVGGGAPVSNGPMDDKAAAAATSSPASAPAAPPASTPSASTGIAVGEPAPGPAPEAETLSVTVTSASAGLLPIWDADGTVWLVPAYVLVTNDGSSFSVPAIDASFLLPATDVAITPQPMPAGKPGVGAPEPAPGVATVVPSGKG